MALKLRLNTDGGVRTGGVKGPTGGKTGRGAVGFVIRDDDGKVLRKGGMELDGDVTVNETEWSALLMGLYNCAEMGATHVTVEMDSQLVVNQANGVWACRGHLIEYRDETLAEAERFEEVVYTWVPRNQNQVADQVVREILK